MARPPKPLVGYNTNVKHLGLIFHVQTEDSGYDAPHVYSHLFKDGAILSTRKNSYMEQRDDADREAIVRRLMQRQHKELLKELKRGLHDQKIANLFGVKLPEKGAPAPAGADDEADEAVAAAGNETADAAADPPPLKGPPTERIPRMSIEEIRARVVSEGFHSAPTAPLGVQIVPLPEDVAASPPAAAARAPAAQPAAAPAAAPPARRPPAPDPAARPAAAAASAGPAAVRLDQRSDSRTAEVLAALERESAAETAAPPTPPPQGGGLPAWFGASRLFEDDEPTPPSGPGLAQPGAVPTNALQLPSWPSVTMPVSSLLGMPNAGPEGEGERDDAGRITERMRVPPVAPPQVNPPVPGRAPAARRATPAYMARPTSSQPPVTPAQAVQGARTPTPPAVTTQPASARPGGPGQTAPRIAGAAPPAPEAVVARPVFRVGAGPAAAPPAPPGPASTVAPPVPPAAAQRGPLPPRVQGGTGTPPAPVLLDPTFGARPAQQPQRPDNIFGEDLVSEKSLDEVILNYLADDLSTGKPPPK
jgi:hypothetical protein